MILIGNQRGGSRDLALHLLKDENDHVDVHEVRGFASETLQGALNEAYAVSRGTRCKQFLFSLSLNPPQGEQVKTEAFEAAIEQVEKRLNLQNQPRAIVFHEKEGRRHAHVVWSRINTDEMKAVQLSHSKKKLMTLSRELFIEHGWEVPRGMIDSKNRDPRNFTLEEWQQAKRQGKDPRAIKQAMQDAWAISDSKTAFTHAMEERGFRIARGDRRGFVAIDHKGEIYALAKWIGIKTKEVRSRLGAEDKLPSVAETKERFANDMTSTFDRFASERQAKDKQAKERFERLKKTLMTRQRTERKNLTERHEARQLLEAKQRQAQFRSGLKGAWDRLRGEHKRIQSLNMAETYQAVLRDRTEKDDLIFGHLNQRRRLVVARKQERRASKTQRREVLVDKQNYIRMTKEAGKDRQRAQLKNLRKRTVSPQNQTRDQTKVPPKERPLTPER